MKKYLYLIGILAATGCSSTPKKIESKSAPAAMGAYSQAIEANGFVFVSGQLGIDPTTNTAPDGIDAQTKQIMQNLKVILNEAGLGFNSVVKTSIFLKSISDFKKVNEIYGSYFSGGIFPARSTVEVGAFPKNFLIEIDMIAVKNK